MPGGSYIAVDFNQWDLANNPVNPSLLDTGHERINQYIEARLAARNLQLNEVLNTFAYWTTEKQLGFGGYTRVTGQEVGEVGRAKPEKGGGGYFCGLPIRQWQKSAQWDYAYFRQARQADMVRDIDLMADADDYYVMSRVLFAMFNPVNYDWTDDIDRDNILMPNVPMHVKSLLNGDGLQIPPGPNGEYFDPVAHTHYDYDTGLTAAKVSALVVNVREHNRGSSVVLWINSLDANSFAALPAANYKPLFYSNITQATTRDTIANPALDSASINDRLIGYYDNAPVMVKPQMPQGYILAIDTAAPQKPVAIRYSDTFGTGRGLSPLVRANDFQNSFPWIAETYGRWIGTGCWGRSSAAILNINQGGGAYVAPSFPALNQ